MNRRNIGHPSGQRRAPTDTGTRHQTTHSCASAHII